MSTNMPLCHLTGLLSQCKVKIDTYCIDTYCMCHPVSCSPMNPYINVAHNTLDKVYNTLLIV